MTRIVLCGEADAPGVDPAASGSAAAATELGGRLGCEFVVVSDDTEDSSRGGWDVVAPIGFASGGDRRAWEARLAAVEAAVGGSIEAVEWDDPVWAVISAVTGADAVLITGGPHLDSRSPEHIYERAALAIIAQALSRPLIVSGQTLTPHLTVRDSELVERIVGSAVLVSVRESASLAVAEGLGAAKSALHHVRDDAGLGQAPTAQSENRSDKGYVVVAFAEPADAMGGAFEALATAAVRTVHATTGLPVVLIASEPEHGGSHKDEIAFHKRVVKAVAGVESRAVARGDVPAIVAQAQLVLTTRYDLTAWVLASGVPTVSLATDAYASIALTGVHQDYDVDEWALPVGAVNTDIFERSVALLWLHREAVAKHVRASGQLLESQRASWWDHVAAVVSGRKPRPVATLSSRERMKETPVAESSRQLRAVMDAVGAELAASQVKVLELRDEVQRLDDARSALEDDVSAARGETDRTIDALRALEQSHEATRRLLEERVSTVVERRLEQAEIEALHGELDALRAALNSRSPLRVAYRRVFRHRPDKATDPGA